MLLVSIHTAAHSEIFDLQGICDLSLTTASTSHLQRQPVLTAQSPITAQLCKVQYRDPCSCPSWDWWFLLLCIFSSFYVEKRVLMRISVSAAVAQEVMMTSWPGGWKEFLWEGFPHLVESSKVGTQSTSLLSGAELVIQERILLSKKVVFTVVLY